MFRRLSIPTLVLLSAFTVGVKADACTRIVYHGTDSNYITARSMDWTDDIETNLWIFPRGMSRNGQAGPKSVQWTSKYGSVTASGYDISTTDGMNEKGPVVALASVFSVIRNVSVPYGISTPGQPNISSTRWRVVADHSRQLYFFESALTPNTFWVDLKNIDFSEKNGKVMKLDLGKNQRNIFAGDATKSFQVSAPFKFMGL